MAPLRLRIGEGDKPQPNLHWDSVWDTENGVADWALADASETQNRGGLRAQAGLHTAIMLALFSDKRVPEDHPHRKFVDGDDLGGWWGNTIDLRADLGEEELGSLIWIYARAPLNEEVRRFVEVAAQEALAPLIKQGAATRIDVRAEIHSAVNRIDLTVQVYGRDGQRVYSQRFSDLWQQAAGS